MMRAHTIRVIAAVMVMAMALTGCKDDGDNYGASGSSSADSAGRKDRDSDGRDSDGRDSDGRDSNDRDSDDRDRDSNDRGSRRKNSPSSTVTVVVTSTQTPNNPQHNARPAAPRPHARTTSSNDDLREVYRSILANPAQIPFNHPDPDRTPNGTYHYSIADIDGDQRPELLLWISANRGGYEDLGYIATISGTSTPGHIKVIDGLLTFGAATAGGARATLLHPDSRHTGVIELTSQSISQDGYDNYYEIRGSALKKVKEVHVSDATQAPAGYCFAKWLPVSDPAFIGPLTDGAC